MDISLDRASADWVVSADETAACALLLAGGMSRRAAVSAYYAVFHAANAMLWAAGVEPSSRHSIAGLLSLHFVKTGPLPADTARNLARLLADRHTADYDVLAVTDPAAAVETITLAAKLLRPMEKWFCQEMQVRRPLLAPPPSALESLDRLLSVSTCQRTRPTSP